jgi:hypothetical protein
LSRKNRPKSLYLLGFRQLHQRQKQLKIPVPLLILINIPVFIDKQYLRRRKNKGEFIPHAVFSSCRPPSKGATRGKGNCRRDSKPKGQACGR